MARFELATSELLDPLATAEPLSPTHNSFPYVYTSETSTRLFCFQASSFDLLFPHCGELAGGTLRENCAQTLTSRLQKLNMFEPYEWYVDLRRFGGVPHGGYGLGFDRLIKFVLGVKNIRDVVPFPRAYHQCHL